MMMAKRIWFPILPRAFSEHLTNPKLLPRLLLHIFFFDVGTVALKE